MAPEITAEFVWSHIPKRPRESNKGSFGAVLAVAGSACYRGAASLTVEGALRTGAGIVTLASVEPVLAAVSARLPECCLCPCEPGAEGGISPQSIPRILRQKATVLLIGPGLGYLAQSTARAAETRTLVKKLLTGFSGSAVLDADGLNAAASLMNAGEELPRPAKELTMDEIIRLMVGRPLTNRFPPKDNVVGDEDILKVEGLTAEYSHLKDANIHVRKGEILGVAGLDSSGRTELLENIFGSATRKSGKIYKNGKLVGNKTPRESIKNGFALVTEERRATGILGILDIRANTVIASLKKYLNGPFLSDKKMAEATDSMIKAMRIKTPSQQTKINTLSGGNQQKVIFGRWILTQPDVLLLDEPTRGIDIGAKTLILGYLKKLNREQGMTIVVTSSELKELRSICDRIVIIANGKIMGVLAPNASDAEYGLMMSGIQPAQKA
mgnify:CR=1 FL=1